MNSFTHLHIHTQYSILDGASNIKSLISRAKELGMTAIAITDHGNMFGVKEFHNEATRQGIKPIIGCEVYVARTNRHDKTGTEDRSGNHLILLAKNLTGYNNLVRMVSLAWIEGHYYKPRIDHELLTLYHEGLIACSACLAGEIPSAILEGKNEKANAALSFYQNLFGDDFYLELMRHKTDNPLLGETYEQQQIVNNRLIDISLKTGIPLIASNDAHFILATDAAAHERLICINTGKTLSDQNRLLYTREEYLKSPDEMAELFEDVPQALENTMQIADKVELYELNHEPILPDFPLPDGFSDADMYLEHLTNQGAVERYGVILPELKERIDFELSVVKGMGYAGYFLIVQDFIQAAREMGVSVGPGRGSAAGSVIAYCVRITDIDPIKYDLLFERFLNPDRVSMPDIDIDFDEDGRDKVIQWVIEKYGKNKVAQIVTFGTMAAKMAIRDVARVESLPLSDADRLAKLVPERPGITLKNAFKDVKELADAKKSSNKIVSATLQYAEELEGSVRHTGLHACGVIIGRDDLINHIPLCISKDSDLLVTQYEGSHVESVGMLKMDFLGLKTLSIIKDALDNVHLSTGVNIDLDGISFEDEMTYELFSKGNTTGIFQFESDGMKKNLKELKPNRFEDLIAMNALYRPGPMEYIPSYIRRKHNKEKISYDHPIMETYLKDTYGITVYQEQVMRLSMAMGGFTRGQSDMLRKAMSKKLWSVMDSLREVFISGCTGNNVDEKIAFKVWQGWESFADYAFNKSHSTCYAFTSYRMAWLKAHYPAEFMAAVLSRNLSDIKKITFFIDECKKQNIPVIGPDVNESQVRFTVNKKREIRFGLAAIKGLGEAAVESIITERKSDGNFSGFYDFMKRVNLRAVNKRSIEALAMAGAFDSFENNHRAQFFQKDSQDDITFIEKMIRHVGSLQSREAENQQSLFDDDFEVNVPDPPMPECEPWSRLEQLKNENAVIGFYMSGHPLDDYKLELAAFSTTSISKLNENLKPLKDREVVFGGMVTVANHRVTKTNKPMGTFTIEDYTDSINLTLFSETYVRLKQYLEQGYFLLVRARVEPRYQREDELEIRIANLELLSETLDKFTNQITLFIPLTDLDEPMVSGLYNLVESNPGKCNLKLRITDPEENITLNLLTRKYKVNADDFLKKVISKHGISYKLN